MKLIPFGMAAKIIVIVENENSRGRIFRTIEIGSCKSAEPSAHNYKIIGFTGVNGGSSGLPELSIAKGVGNGERSVVAAAHPRESRRVVSRSILWKCRRFVSGESESRN